MLTRFTPTIVAFLIAVAGAARSEEPRASLAPVDALADAPPPLDDHASHVSDSPIDANLFLEAFSIDEIRKEFPISAGMTVAAVDAIAKQQDSLAFEEDHDETYSLGWEKRDIQDGNGWIYFWVNGKQLLHCDLVIENDRVKSVWIMPGNREWVSFVYCRLSGAGQHGIEGRTATDPSQIESDEQLTSIKTPAHIDRLWLHSEHFTDEGMKHLTAFSNLRKLEFNYPGITEDSLQHLGALTNLRELHLGTVPLTDSGVVHLAILKGLEELIFWQNKEISDEGIRQLRPLENLKLLRLDGTSITDRGLVHLTAFTELEELSLADCKGITDGGAKALLELSQLKSLSLLNSGITETGAEELKKELPNCRVIGP